MFYIKSPFLSNPGKSIQKGKSALSAHKHSAKNLLSFRSLTSEVRSRPSSDSINVEDMASSDLEPPPSFKENTNQCISNVSAQYGGSNSVRDATQENISETSIAPVPGRAVSQQQSLSGHVPNERSVEKRYMLPSSIQHTNSSIAPVQAPHEYAINVTGDKQQRSYSMPGQISGELFRNADDTMKQQRSHSFPTQIRPDG